MAPTDRRGPQEPKSALQPPNSTQSAKSAKFETQGTEQLAPGQIQAWTAWRKAALLALGEHGVIAYNAAQPSSRPSLRLSSWSAADHRSPGPSSEIGSPLLPYRPMKPFLACIAIALFLTYPAVAQQPKAKGGKSSQWRYTTKTSSLAKEGRPRCTWTWRRPQGRRNLFLRGVHSWRRLARWKLQGSRAAEFDCAAQGYVSATVQYRLVPTARWPAEIEDVKIARSLSAGQRRQVWN